MANKTGNFYRHRWLCGLKLLTGMKCYVMIQKSWVWTSVRSTLEVSSPFIWVGLQQNSFHKLPLSIYSFLPIFQTMWRLNKEVILAVFVGHNLQTERFLRGSQVYFSWEWYLLNNWLKQLKSASHNNWCTGTLLNELITAQWEGMGDVGSARYEPALGTTSPMPDHKGVLATVSVRDPPTPFLCELSEILAL